MGDFPRVLDKKPPGLSAEFRILNGVDGGGVHQSQKEAGVAIARAAGNAVAIYSGRIVVGIGRFVGAEIVNSLGSPRIVVGPTVQAPFGSYLGRMVAMDPGSGE